ncbi:MAG: 2-oxoacid:ferredoxin oxidoreductase subunit beta [Chloroflexi bacterium]|nr:2-oxoacid:ferredoxin oxidoreductase subunit beta [Chloroflexota bacterium]MBI3176630.1 2-oxoacid:ferredoxin oxidoreductase subunit beta [Chloroflexota bacterium]
MTLATPSRGNVKTNKLGLEKAVYKGLESTLCNGCGHDSISARIIDACYDLSIKSERVAKFSGIGCSSKSPAYFLNRSHGFNSLHGRMPSVATGAMVANHTLVGIGVSGDGDTGSIGIGQFKHAMRRNVPMVYIVENNGVYGLTKGQFSATADVGQELKHAGRNELPPIDLCLEAIIADCGFVARSFAGDPRQVSTLLKAALSYEGVALLDIISPCVTFNDKDESTKSYAWGKEHNERIIDATFIPYYEEITVDYTEGEAKDVELHDGSHIVLRKLDRSHDPTRRMAAIQLLEEAKHNQEFVTGLIYLNEGRPDLRAHENLHPIPLAYLPESLTRPPKSTLAKLMEQMS